LTLVKLIIELIYLFIIFNKFVNCRQTSEREGSKSKGKQPRSLAKVLKFFFSVKGLIMSLKVIDKWASKQPSFKESVKAHQCENKKVIVIHKCKGTINLYYRSYEKIKIGSRMSCKS